MKKPTKQAAQKVRSKGFLKSNIVSKASNMSGVMGYFWEVLSPL